MNSDTQYIIVNMAPDWEVDMHGSESEAHTLKPCRRPKYVHDDLESAEKEALRLHKAHAGPQGRFVIFRAVQTTAWRKPWEIAASTIAVLEPIEIPVQPIPERAPKKKRRKQP
ncbi:MAG: hypothetical protein WAW39_22210 [Prosthecobacter sp.]|uniref:hypothetical protein n=1 Tax=Prosthecobacter sp. TaxID=1965333 RepID=UPI003BAEA7B7